MSWRLSRFRAGDWVIVRNEAEILSTLDDRGCVDGLPFMPEMLQYCGRKMRVRAVAHKTCETALKTWQGRRLETTVHLEDALCDGSAHGGCQADCSLFWKDVWLAPADRPTPLQPPANASGLSAGQLLTLTILPAVPGEPLSYTCQATQLYNATTPLAWWDLRQYWRDVVTRNHSLKHVLSVLWNAVAKHTVRRTPVGYRLLKSLRERTHRWLTGREVPDYGGMIPPGQRTPQVHSCLKPGDYVRVKSKEEIAKTLDMNSRNRGLSFDPEMAVYCGRIFRVRRCVTEILDEQTGKMVAMKNPCIMLEGALCSAQYSECRLLCPRALPPYWREIWLEKIEVESAVGLTPAVAQEMPHSAETHS